MKRWYKCRCCYCGRRIAVKLNKDAFVNMSNPLAGNSCFHCVSEKSPARNGCDESAFKTKELRRLRMNKNNYIWDIVAVCGGAGGGIRNVRKRKAD